MRKNVKSGLKNKAVLRSIINKPSESVKVYCCGNGCNYCVLDFKIPKSPKYNLKNNKDHPNGKNSK